MRHGDAPTRRRSDAHGALPRAPAGVRMRIERNLGRARRMHVERNLERARLLQGGTGLRLKLEQMERQLAGERRDTKTASQVYIAVKAKQFVEWQQTTPSALACRLLPVSLARALVTHSLSTYHFHKIQRPC